MKTKAANTTDNQTSLELASKSWNHDEWEAYLSAQESPQTEEFLTDVPDIYACEADEKLEQPVTENFFFERVREAVSGLSEKQKSIVLLIFWEGKSEREVAALLGISRSSVRTMSARIYKKIRTKVSPVFPIGMGGKSK